MKELMRVFWQRLRILCRSTPSLGTLAPHPEKVLSACDRQSL